MHNGIPGWASGDLFREHSNKKGVYQMYGRIDEQIVLSNGEKTNPVPLGTYTLNSIFICIIYCTRTNTSPRSEYCDGSLFWPRKV
jgi:long-subunit acyl-CoA synthetase (AMP-forming)